MSYAEKTDVPVIRTRQHIEELLEAHQADSMMIATTKTPPQATVAFRIQGWGVRMRIGLPDEGVRRADQVQRSRWRALYLTLKAKLVSVESGVETFEEAFLPHLVLAGGSTVMDQVRGELTPGMTEFPQLGSGQ